MITKGAVHPVLDACTRTMDGVPLDAGRRERIERLYQAWSGEGQRLLAVAVRDLPLRSGYTRADETDLALAGFVAFLDQPRMDAANALESLARAGVSVKIITGDNAPVTRHIATLVGLGNRPMMTGRELDRLNDEALWHAVERNGLFVEVDSRQKERIIVALRKMGHVVGFLGDGINDAPAMHAADTSLSVDSAVDVAREAADFVLVERGLDVIARGIEEGRRTFANTLKYVLTTTSANLGNMVSMAIASLFLPFLPLLAGQILLNNLLSDVPAIGIADDSVDAELVERPERWSMRFISRFMVEFGLLSSIFDLLTFAVLLVGFGAVPELFRTAWFVESLLTELVIALVVRTRRPILHSRPGRLLLGTTAALVPIAFAIPYLPAAGVLGFVPLPPGVVLALVGITALYVVAAEAGKRHFYREG
jgi:Mg2+-importing ATPase